MSKYGNYTMRYDELGNPISYKGYSMVWTKGRQLAALSDTQTTMAFKYDSNGIRTLKRVNGVDTEFTYAGTTLISQKTGNEIINFAYTAGGAPYGFTYNGTSYFYLLNLQGDVIGIYDSTGTVVVKYAYDSWGQLMSITGTLADTIGVKNPLRYRGYYYDTETKLYYLQSRYYDPETCHFISMDSYFVAGDYINGMNMYAYCLNNPVMYVDPTGYEPDFINLIQFITKMLPVLSAVAEFMAEFLSVEPEDGEITNSVDITEELNKAMVEHANELKEYQMLYGDLPALLYFAYKEMPGGDWDLKISWKLDKHTEYIYDGLPLRYDDVGNIHYGYVGRVLVGTETLLNLGGIIQIITGTSDWAYKDFNFDDPRDQWAINFGCCLWDEGVL